jgi:hypothetical protein
MKNEVNARLIACGAVIAIICVTMFVIGKTVNVHQEPVAGVQMTLPNNILGWRGFPAKVSQIEREILGEDTEFARNIYISPDGRQGFFLSIVLSGKDRTSIHPPEMCLRGQGWQLLPNTEVIPIRISQPASYELDVMKLEAYIPGNPKTGDGTPQKLIYLYWFVGKDVLTPFKNTMTFRESWDRIAYGKSHRWAYVTLAATTRPGDEKATLRLMEIFLESAVPSFQLVGSEADSL